MSPDPDQLSTTFALVLRLAAAWGALWCGMALCLTFAQRAGGSDRRVQRSWLVTSAVIAGVCLWAAHLCAGVSLSGVASWPFGAATLAMLLSMGSLAALLATAVLPSRQAQIAGGAGSALMAAGSATVWAAIFGWRFSPSEAAAMVAGLAAAQGVLAGCVGWWHRHRRSARWRQRALVALLPSAAQALPLMVLGLLVSPPVAVPLGGETLFALLAATMAALALQAWRMERHLIGKHQMLGAQLQQANAHLKRTPFSDPLTGLLSRLGLEAALRKAAMQAENQGMRVALLAIGLDGFRSVNDTFGHALGDSVLREVARKLIEHRASLEPLARTTNHAMARIGGDEFVLMLQGPLDRPSLSRMAAHVLAALDGPINCGDQELRLSASIGVACFPEDGGASKLIARANAAMQAAKSAGGSAYMTFEPRMEDDARDRHELLRDLRQAIENKQLELFYQPKIDARSGQVTAAEALLRWHHPVRGTLTPDAFVPLAERHGLIGALGNWVIEDACRQARVWRERGLKMRMAINLSVFQMRQNDLVERIQAALKRHGVNPSRLTCEITESVAMEDTQVTQRTFERLGQAGIHLSIDDFGTGYSSLSYLRRLPATELKIDRSFVMDLDNNADARAIVDAVLKLAHAIGLKVVAEGVETMRQRDILLELGCDEFQGYLFARPMSARALMLWAVDDKPKKNAFRPSLFSETEGPSIGGLRHSAQPSLQSLPGRRTRGS